MAGAICVLSVSPWGGDTSSPHLSDSKPCSSLPKSCLWPREPAWLPQSSLKVSSSRTALNQYLQGTLDRYSGCPASHLESLWDMIYTISHLSGQNCPGWPTTVTCLPARPLWIIPFPVSRPHLLPARRFLESPP